MKCLLKPGPTFKTGIKTCTLQKVITYKATVRFNPKWEHEKSYTFYLKAE